MQERRPVRIITTPPIVAIIGQTELNPTGIVEMARWVHENRPECLPEGLFDELGGVNYQDDDIVEALFPHDLTGTDPFAKWRKPAEQFGILPSVAGGEVERRALKGGELLPELAGRKCYDSFGAKAGRKSNADYLNHVLSSSPPHASVMYHTHLTFFIGNTSRRLSQEMFRNYVGSHADHEGSPSQESTRYTVHHGAYVAHPYDIEQDRLYGDGIDYTRPLRRFERECQTLYDMFMDYVDAEMTAWHAQAVRKLEAADDRGYPGGPPDAADAEVRRKLYGQTVKMPTDVKKAILGAAAQRHGWGFATSYIWTTNSIALIKLFKERDHAAADPEFRRLAHTWKRVAVMAYPNLFPMFVNEVLEELERESSPDAPPRITVHVGNEVTITCASEQDPPDRA